MHLNHNHSFSTSISTKVGLIFPLAIVVTELGDSEPEEMLWVLVYPHDFSRATSPGPETSCLMLEWDTVKSCYQLGCH